jgi:hypothetical protein
MSLFVLNEQLIFFQNQPAQIYERLYKESDKINSAYFVGSAYWFMWPFGVSNQLQNSIVDIRDGVMEGKDEIYSCVKQSYLNTISAS